jgi:hypothetical protein
VTRQLYLAAALGVALALPAPWALALTPSPELQARVRAATFEVVIHKALADPLSYEKPLPTELIPFLIRNDAYWSLGTAFALGANSFVSAGHVMTQGVASQLGAMALRDAAGHIYPVERVLKYSLDRDYMVFTVSGAPSVTALEVNRAAVIDQPVFAAGNALGEGVVIRDGLYTSQTPEAQEGRWKWLRFSAAASPGNSGGPLLDGAGRVLGVVEAKSENENLNYALPIAEVLDAPERARVESRGTISVPNLQATAVSNMKVEFALPASYQEFARNYLGAINSTLATQRAALLQAHASEIFPRGDSAKLLGTVNVRLEQASIIAQDEDRIWELQKPVEVQSMDVPVGGRVAVASVAGVAVLRIERPDHAADAGFYASAADFSGLLLKGFKLYRPVGTDRVRVTALGPVAREETYRDAYGRVWQLRLWPLAYMDSWLVTLALPVPDGYVAFIQTANGQLLEGTLQTIKYLCDYALTSYSGTLPQWRSFLGLKQLRPRIFDDLQLSLDNAAGVKYRSARLKFEVPPELVALSDHSKLRLDLNLLDDAGKLDWNVVGIAVFGDADRDSYVQAVRHVRPEPTADAARQRSWNELTTRAGTWMGVPGHDNASGKSWVGTTVAAGAAVGGHIDGAARIVYSLYAAVDGDILPRQLDAMEQSLVSHAQVLEH